MILVMIAPFYGVLTRAPMTVEQVFVGSGTFKKDVEMGAAQNSSPWGVTAYSIFMRGARLYLHCSVQR